MIQKNHIYFILCTASIVLSITALILNIKTVPLIKKQHLITKQIQILKEKNQHLHYKIQKESTFENIEKKAQALNMVYLPSKKIKHIYLSKKTPADEK
ncbi:MAG: hypothetical protein CL503_05435 [Actinobacteria bacterium]|nr:hypothetical protein [Actinomycetota bacterium]|tara:strand:- start:15587 stop:15880 length:294 start_codon:yes stop_codon:yes gene_type:complete